jgi:hypothetical protein
MASFADVFYRLWKDELPVFISCDALLQAWHRTYDAQAAVKHMASDERKPNSSTRQRRTVQLQEPLD